ncbi:hypothetical protein PFLUV_G00145320 [Perca fluviatilis]|uniref:Uncharacterized protein n=1 Tax=Perca fluviatilis TaxID=8168 RepID=A0A6A5EVX7_PERFL|nr:hypothetical protein PFLUV_G00145320 [Perca fluviatilis]
MAFAESSNINVEIALDLEPTNERERCTFRVTQGTPSPDFNTSTQELKNRKKGQDRQLDPSGEQHGIITESTALPQR